MSANHKLVGWLVAAVLAACAIAVAWALIDNANHQRDALADEVRDLKTSIEDLRKQKALDDEEHIKTEAALSFERELRTKSEARNTELEKKNAGLLAENASFRDQIKTWNDAQLVTEMAKVVGDTEVGSVLNGQWHFSLTRVGGERTVGRFKDAETYFNLSQNQALQISEKSIQIVSLNNSLALQTAETKRESDGRVAALSKLDDAESTIGKMQKASAKDKRNAALKGGAVASVLFLLLHTIFGK